MTEWLPEHPVTGSTLSALATILFSTVPTSADLITPNAWGIARSKAPVTGEGKECVQQAPSACVCEEDLGTIYYKKLVNYLFRQSKQIVDDFDRKHLISVHLQITEDQLRQLKAAESVREIDAIVFTVIANSKNDFLQEAKEKLWSWFDQLHYLYLRIINSQSVRVISYLPSSLLTHSIAFQIMLLFLLGLFLSSMLIMRYLFKVNVIVSLIVNVLAVSLFFEYLECNRRLEFSNLEKLKSMDRDTNPCQHSTKFFGLISTYDSSQCTEYMMSIHGHNRQFCLPTDVFMEFMLKLFFKPFSQFLDRVSDFVEQTYGKYGTWKGIPIIIAILISLTYWLRSVLKVLVEGLFLWLTNRKPRQQSERLENIEGNKTNAPIINVNVTIDPRAIGDYVQTVKNDEERSRPAITLASGDGSPVKQIEDVSNGSEISSTASSVEEEKKEQ